jgi:C-terminal processing protease CtpA/Prc
VSSLSPSSFRSAFDPDEVCGIGLVFKADQTGALFVSTVVPLGPAHLSGQVRQGDILYEVDGVNLYRQPASACASRLMGLRGTHITVCFLRDGQPLEVHLVRERIDSQRPCPTRLHLAIHR